MEDKSSQIILPPFVCDDLHFDAREVDGHNKPWNFVVCEREAGKSTLAWKKVYNAFRNEHRPSLVLKRQIIDITDQYIEDTERLLNQFTNANLHFKYKKQDIKQGQMDLYINGEVFVRLIGLSAPMSRLKSMFLPKVKYIMMDEFICNLRLGEKYLTDEPMRIKELYTTYNRETVRYNLPPIKVYFFGNPYSLYNPYFSWKNVPSNKLYPGALVAGDDYVVQCYKIKDELKEKILKGNPLYQFDEAYKSYAFDGRAVQDVNIRIIEKQPDSFKLQYVMKLNNKILGIYKGFNEGLDLFYWCRIVNENEISKNREIICFDFGQMADKTVLYSKAQGKTFYMYFKQCVERRQIAYETIESSYFVEEIYNTL